MKMFAVADEADVLTGLRLSGIEGKLATNKEEAEAFVAEAEQASQTAVLLITENCAAMIPQTVTRLKLSSMNLLVVVIPGTGGSNRPKDSITGLIRDAIGIKI